MQIPRIIVWMFSFCATATVADIALSQNYPSKPVRIVTSGVGSNNDFVVRLMTPGLSGSLGQPVIVDNRSNGAVPGDIVSKAPPDGHTLLLMGSSFSMGPLLQQVSYDVQKDFSPITLVARAPNVLVVHPSLPVKSVKELIALARTTPGKLNVSTGGSGSASHLAAELFQYMAEVKMTGIRYSNSAVRMADLIGGQVQLEFATAGGVAPHVKSGRLRALAVTSADPSALMPGVPTVAASGVPGYESVGMTGMFAPAKAPAPVIMRLNQEVARILNQPEIRQKLGDSGVEAIGNSPQDYAAKIKSEMDRMEKLIKVAGIKAD